MQLVTISVRYNWRAISTLGKHDSSEFSLISENIFSSPGLSSVDSNGMARNCKSSEVRLLSQALQKRVEYQYAVGAKSSDQLHPRGGEEKEDEALVAEVTPRARIMQCQIGVELKSHYVGAETAKSDQLHCVYVHKYWNHGWWGPVVSQRSDPRALIVLEISIP